MSSTNQTSNFSNVFQPPIFLHKFSGMDSLTSHPFHIVIANVLSLCTIAIGFVSKIPQIQTVISNKSAKGISILAVGMEVMRYAIMWMYNFCFGYSLLSYLEYPLLLVQQTILFYFVLKFNQLISVEIVLFGFLLAITILLFLTEVLPRVILAFLISFCPLIAASSRIIQLIRILRTQNADNISLTSWFLTAFAGFARCYTILVESGDKMLLFNSITTFTTSASVYITAIYLKKTRKIE